MKNSDWKKSAVSVEIQAPVKSILVREVPRSGYIVAEKEGSRGFITRKNFGDGDYLLRSLTDLTEGNGWAHWDSPYLETLLNDIIANRWKVYYLKDKNDFLNFFGE